MAQPLNTRHYDVVVIGGGAAGVAAAVAAAKSGAATLLVEAGPLLGGDLVSGLPIDGCLNARGEWIIGGVSREFFAACEALGGYIGPVCDWRLMYGVCLDPEAMKLAVIDVVARHNVTLLLYTFAEDVVVEDGRVTGVIVVNKNGRTLLTAGTFVDCTGDGDIALKAGAPSEKGGKHGAFQPVSLIFRLAGVDTQLFLEFVRDNPDQFMLGENPVFNKTRAEAAVEVYRAGYPMAALTAEGSILRDAIASGEMFATMGVYMWPTSLQRRELAFNTTRVADLDATDTEALSASLATLAGQARIAMRFVKRHVPGLEDASLSGVAPRIGIRETRRIVGEYVLTAGDVREGRKFDDGVAKGGHHIDIHGSGTYQKRTPVKDGRSYDIPYGCLVPRTLSNVLVAGRCLSSTREANGSARTMAQCMATGEAAGTAAAMCVECGWEDVRQVPVQDLRRALKAQGAVVDGTN
jgi:hypothetical protein